MSKKNVKVGIDSETKYQIAHLSQDELKGGIMSLDLQTSIYEGNLDQVYQILVLKTRDDLIDPDMCPNGFIAMMKSGAKYYQQCKLVLDEYLKYYIGDPELMDKSTYIL